MSKFSTIAKTVFIVLLATSTGWAQDGVITGKVSDSSGALIPGVEITLTSPGVMGTRNFVSDEQGGYRFTFLPPGVYALRFELPGFRTLIREGIQMTAGFTATLNAVLEVASTTETVTVVGESPIIDVTNAVVATNFTSELTSVLPTGHDIFSVLAVTPGVQITIPDVGGSRAAFRSQFRVFGSVTQWNVIEGAIMATLQYEDPDLYQEVQVGAASKGSDAPVGGSFNNFIMKSGGNSVHGMAYYDREPLKLQSSNLSEELRQQGVRNTSSVARYQAFHGDVGGPFMQDKFWWFYGFRNLNSDQFIPDFVNAQTGDPEPGRSILRNHGMKLSYQLNPNHSLSYAAQYNTKIQPNAGGSAFVNSAVTALTDFPYWLQGITLNSVLSRRATLEVKWGEWGWRWWARPGLNEIPSQDLDTREVRGGRPNPFVDRSHHMNIQGVLGVNTSGTDIGNHNFRIGYGYLFEGAPYAFHAPKDNIQTFWRGGFQRPVEIETYDSPFSFENDVRHQWFFANDTWNIRRLTINAGFRFDTFLPYYPEQGKPGVGPYQEKVTYPEFKFHRLNGAVPRLSLVYDVFGNGRTAIKASFSKYVYNAGTITNANSMMAGFVNPMARTIKRYKWDGTLPFIPDPANLIRTTGGPNRKLDPDLELPVTEEYVAGIDQEVMRDMTLRFNFVRKFERNRMHLLNTAIPFSAYNIPVTFTDPGRDGSTGTADDSPITVFNLQPAYRGLRSDVLTNDPSNSSSFTTYNLEAVKRFSTNWQLLTGFDISHYKAWAFASALGQDISNDTNGVPQDPNRLKYNNGINYWHWQYKALGSYELPYGVNFSASLRMTKGEPHGRTLNTPSLNQGVISLVVEPRGSFFYDTVKIFDLRFSKSVTLGERGGKLEGLVDLFNVNNSSAVLSRNNQTGSAFGQVLTTVNPRIARLGVRWTF